MDIIYMAVLSIPAAALFLRTKRAMDENKRMDWLEYALSEYHL